MELTSTILGDSSQGKTEKPELFILDVSAWFPALSASLNLLPADIQHPDDEVLIKMVLSAVQARFAPAPQVLKAKCDHLFAEADDGIRNSIFSNMLAMALTVIESYNHFQLWSKNGNAMYEFDHFVNQDTVALRKIQNFSLY